MGTNRTAPLLEEQESDGWPGPCQQFSVASTESCGIDTEGDKRAGGPVASAFPDSRKDRHPCSYCPGKKMSRS